MDQTYRSSPERDKLFEALAEVQLTLENVERDAANPGFKRGNEASKYASLGAVLDLARPALAKAGLSLCQMPTNGEGNNIGVVTVLGHKSGQWLESTLYVAPAQFTAQGAGSVITYLRRYAAMAMVGLAPEDDDGNAASAVSAPVRPQRAPSARRSTDAAEEELRDARDAWARIHKVMENAKLPAVIDETVARYADDLQKIKKASAEAYEGLIQFANARKSEMLAAA